MKLSICILSFNTKVLLQQTIESLPRHKDWEVIVVDNASKDGSVDMLQAKFPWITVIQNTENVGFAAGNNQAIKKSEGTYVLLLNSDTIVQRNALERLIAYMDEHSDVGMITPKVVLPNGKIDPACHRGMPTPWRSLCYYAGLEKLFPKSALFAGYHQTYLNLDEPHQIETTAATALVVRRKAVDRVGLLDENFFLYGEDLDWCYRFSKSGWKIVYYPDAEVTHLKSQSGKNKRASKTQIQATTHFYDTMKQFYEKHYQSTYPSWLRYIVYKGIDLKKWLALRNLG